VTVCQGAVSRRTRPPSAAGDSRFVCFARAACRELTLIAALFLFYKLARGLTADDVGLARQNAERVLSWERWLHLPSEAAFQDAILEAPWLVEAANTFYATVHFPVSIACVVWLFVRHRAHYRWMLTSIVVLTLSALVVHLTFPLAPPRMMAGFVDTGVVYGQSVYAGAAGRSANQIAAMPSLHVGWALLVALALIRVLHTRWRWLALAHPTLTVLVVVATANHYWLDGIVAALMLAATLLVVSHATGGTRAREFAEGRRNDAGPRADQRWMALVSRNSSRPNLPPPRPVPDIS